MAALQSGLLIARCCLPLLFQIHQGDGVTPQTVGALTTLARAWNASEQDRAKLRAELYSIPGWEDEVANKLVKLTIASRYDNRREKLGLRLGELWPRWEARTMNEAERLEFQTLDAEARREDRIASKISPFRIELGSIIVALGNLRDDQSVRFIAPLLAEQSETMDESSDASVGSAQAKAANALRILTYHNVQLKGSPKLFSVEEWRKWWAENRKHYEPIPPALAALEATEGGTKRPPAPLPAPPKSSDKPRTEPTEAPTAPASPAEQHLVASTSPWPWLAGAVALLVSVLFTIRQLRKGRNSSGVAPD